MIRLRTLHLASNPITGTGLRHLAGLKELRELKLDHDPLTEEGVREVGELSSLNKLVIAASDQTLAHLVVLAELRELHVGYLCARGVRGEFTKLIRPGSYEM